MYACIVQNSYNTYLKATVCYQIHKMRQKKPQKGVSVSVVFLGSVLRIETKTVKNLIIRTRRQTLKSKNDQT